MHYIPVASTMPSLLFFLLLPPDYQWGRLKYKGRGSEDVETRRWVEVAAAQSLCLQLHLVVTKSNKLETN